MPEQVTQSGPPQWYQQMLQQFYPGAFALANRGYQPYMGPQVAPMSQITQQALGMYGNAMGGSPTTYAADNFLGGLLNGGANPYLDTMASNITSEANKAFDSHLSDLNGIFSNPNSFGGSRHQLGASELSQDFGKGLGQSLGALRYGAFNDDLNRRMQGVGLAQSMQNSRLQNLAMGAQLGNIPRQIQQQFYDQGQQNFREWRDYPQQQASWLANMFGIGNPGTYSSTTTPDPNRLSQWIGGLGLLGSGLGWFGK